MDPLWPRRGASGTAGWFLVVAVVAFAVVVGVLTYRTFTRITPLREDTGSFADFRDASYYPAVAFNDGADPYDTPTYREQYPVAQGFPLYAPHFILANEPFVVLDLEWARALHFVLTIGLAVALAAFTTTRDGGRATVAGTLLVAAALLASLPGRFALQTGQSTMLTVLACTVAWYLAPRRPVVGGIAIAAALMKPIIGVPFAILLLAARPARRAVVVGAAIAGVASLAVVTRLALAVGGLGALRQDLDANLEWTTSLPQYLAGSSPFRVDAVSTWARLIDWAPPSAVEWGIAALIVAFAATVLARGRRPPAGGGPIALLVAVLAVLLAGFQPTYHLLLLAAPLYQLAFRPDLVAWLGARRRWVLVALLTWPLLNPFSWEALVTRYGDQALWVEVLGPSSSGACLIAAFVIAVRQLRRAPAESPLPDPDPVGGLRT